MLEYFEVAPPAALASTVECFWISNQCSEVPHEHVVSPDGCADLLFTCEGNASALQFVGPMTNLARFTLPPGQLCVAARFHPGCWTQMAHTNADLLTDRIVPFESLVPKAGRRLREQLINEADPQRLVQILAADIKPEPNSRLSSLLGYLASVPQHVCFDSLAFDVGITTRQLRRQILRQTGLSPKLLTRILRFRHAAARLGNGEESHAMLASSCGYFDQSHLIAEYRYFTGRTPAAAIASRLASERLPARSPAARQ